MGRAVFGLLLGFAMVFGVVYWVRTCLPEPGDDIEWLHRENAIIVQMKLSGGDVPWGDSIDAFRPPRFTLYGDGTLIVADTAESCAASTGVCETLWESKLPDDDVRKLLSVISDAGFFNFNYKQPQPPVSGAATTYIFVALKEVQNAVRANALGWNEKGDEWDQFRRLEGIDKRLEAIRAKALERSSRYMPLDGRLDITAFQSGTTVEMPAWAFPQFDIGAAASEGEVGDLRLTADKLAQLELPDVSTTACWCSVQHAGRAFDVYYRPVLPYEENFPEFEPPSGAQVPEPGEEIEWVQRPEAVAVQMKVNGFQLVESNGIDPYIIVPEFTLYGDGTLIASKTGSKCPCPLVKAKLSNSQVEDLLRYIDDSGFFNFSYIEPGGPDSFPTTYIYAAMKNAQNISGRHFGLATCIGDCTPPSHYRTLGQIEARLKQVIEEAVSSGTAADYWADSIVLSAKITNVTIRSTPPEWPLPQVDLATIANGSDFGSRRMEGDLARQVQEVLADYHGETDYLVNGQWYAAGYRPVLPYEENFPEFEPPAR